MSISIEQKQLSLLARGDFMVGQLFNMKRERISFYQRLFKQLRLTDEEKTLSRDEVCDQLLSFMVTGHKTTALTMGWIIAQNVAEKMTVGKYRVKKGSAIAVCPLITHRDPRCWDRPNEFIPERFMIGGDPKYKAVVKNAYLPFSLVERNCIGARFVLLKK